MLRQGGMRIAILGGTGRTGRLLVEAAAAAGHEIRVLSRRPLQRQGVEVVLGDALNAQHLRALVRGVDAVACVLGPSPASPADVCSVATGLLIEAMKAEGVNRLVVQTGAMVGHGQLSRFYRWMSSRPQLAQVLEERRAQERAVQHSGLNWTLVRPPRLTNRKGTGGVLVGEALPVRMLSSVARVDLAGLLLRAATSSEFSGQGVTVLQGYSSARPAVVLRSWAGRMALAEFLGIGLVAAVALTFLRVWGEPHHMLGALAFLGCMLAAGAVEGALLGFLPGAALARAFPRLSGWEFGRNTLMIAAAAWLLGMLPSTLMTGASGATSAGEPALWTVLAISSAGGAFAGSLMGTAQWLALRKAVPRAGRWVYASAVGWAIGLPLDVLAGTLPEAGDAWALSVALGAGLGLVAGLLVALPTGLLLIQLLRERDAGVSPPVVLV